jgi:hypothetical protein
MSGLVGTSHTKSKVIGRSLDTAKAWVNFNGTGTVAIRSSFNVSTITDHSTGTYSVNFINSMPNANYSATIGSTGGGYVRARDIDSISTGSVKVLTKFSENGQNTTLYDEPIVTVQVFGD